jgi:hypothetical protein
MRLQVVKLSRSKSQQPIVQYVHELTQILQLASFKLSQQDWFGLNWIFFIYHLPSNLIISSPWLFGLEARD